MIEQYFNAAISQARERTRTLKTKLPNPLISSELIGLQRLCEQQLDHIIQVLDFLHADSNVRRPELASERLRLFRRTHADLARLETTGIAALNRAQADDVFLSKLVFRIHQEIHFPLMPPMVTCLSQDYYYINPSLSLLAVPLAEANSLLHLPDLYHEMGHLLICAKENPKAEPFQHELGSFKRIVSIYMASLRISAARLTGPSEHFSWLADNIELSWVKYWAEELFCDLFAVLTLGPAYVSAHLHLTVERGDDPCTISRNGLMSHPPDNARMEALLCALVQLGWQDEARQIKERWEALLGIMACDKDTLYLKACPLKLIQDAVSCASRATIAIGCRLAKPKESSTVHDLLNTAWNVFWQESQQYTAWEQKSIGELRKSL